ncbi:hypothetical protein [Polynucleobacter sp. CS-Odin-A6]|uniref:hypothetical protein n=1 Tax=Polynucleobacter sp. CS-Odin-A6 TaxID=2689106 RepID=UPI001C0E719E|nr:hypothetical protein [Polynucleobacter sp. CS-Odin-A6]MBU3622007.1 hypothetical protein [Polynucleobacter sp. CS-Odin-A6]
MDVNTPIPIELFLKEAVFSLGVMSAVVTCNIYSFTWLSLKYRKVLDQNQSHGLHFEVLRYVLFIMFLVIAMFLSLFIWVATLMYFEFSKDWVTALLFTAGFFTTIGNTLITLPIGWRFIPSIIAFSGLFSFAWATGASIGMFNYLSRHLDKHRQS